MENQEMTKKYLILLFLVCSWIIPGVQSSHASVDDNDLLNTEFLKLVVKEISTDPDHLTKSKTTLPIQIDVDFDGEKFINGKFDFFLYTYPLQKETSSLGKSFESTKMFIFLPEEFPHRFLKTYTKETDNELENWLYLGEIKLNCIKNEPTISFRQYVHYDRKDMFFIGFK